MRGKVLCMVKQPEMERDHPRVCGEKLSSAIAEAMPPRITPACAGKSKRRGGALALEEDHPRVCGEKLLCRITYGSPQGSPPRVRGKEEIIGIPANIVRITPACAGKRLKKAHKIKDFDPVPIRFHLVFRRFERWCSNLPTPDGNVPV